MYFFSNNFGDNLNYFLLNDMIEGNINFYDRTFKNQNDKSRDLNNINNLNIIAKIDLIFIGSNLDVICNWSYAFDNKSYKHKSIISKLYFKIFDYFYPLIIYGTGFISSDNYQNESYVRNIKIKAIRGNVSLQRIEKNGIKASEKVILADPGILAPFLLNLTNKKDFNFQKEYDLCVIPHFVDSKNILIKTHIQINNSIILNINSNPIEFIRSLLKCKNILSSGLHGLIVADSLGIPNMRMIVSDKIIGGDYKFRDYYSAYNLEIPPYIDLRKENFNYEQIKKLNNNHFISKEIIRDKQCKLLSNFPFQLKKKYKEIKKIICNQIFEKWKYLYSLLENEINFDETICRFIKGKLKNRIQPLEYEEELSFIISLILCKIPFSFVRFGDGEEHIMTGKPFATARDKWAWNNKDKKFQISLIKSASICNRPNINIT